jgi:GMP synthase-like glutamine amidotransferase
MAQTNKQPLKVAVLDLYDGVANEGMRGFREILQRYQLKNNLELSVEVFDVRKKGEFPGTQFDIYISSGGPGSPLTENEVWDKKYFQLIDKLEDHNLSNNPQKKYGFFVCHSFQLLCRKYQLGDIDMRRSPSFGVLPIHLTKPGIADPVHKGLSDPFYAVDSRSWQVINPNEKRFVDLGMQLLAIEKIREHIDLPRAMMAIRFSKYFMATQFHPEADAQGTKLFLLDNEKKKEVVDEHGRDKYNQILERLDDPDMITHTQNTIIPNFLDEAILSLQ